MAAKKKDDKGTSLALPDYLKDVSVHHAADGFTAEDVKMPVVRLLQGTSTAVTEHADAQPGIFWHDGMDESLEESFEFVIANRKKRYLLMAPLDDGQGVLARADDAETWDTTGEWEVQLDKKTKTTWSIKNRNVKKSGLTEWGSYDPDDVNSPPAATLFYEYLVVIPGRPDISPVMIVLARSAIKKAKKGLNDKVLMHRQNGRPMQALKFIARPFPDKNSVGQSFFNWQFTGAGFADEETYESAMTVARLNADFSADEKHYSEEKAADNEDDAHSNF